MRHLKRSLTFLAVVAGAACAMPAAAITWTNSALADGTQGSNPGSGTSGACYTAGTVNTSEPCQFTLTSGGQTLKVRGYSTISSNSQTGMLRSATLMSYTGGFGISNNSGDAGETSTPEHSVDNSGALDVLVFELPATGFDIDAFMLGWAQEGSNTSSNSSDVQAWFGGNNLGSDFNFSQACLSSCAAGTSLSDLGLTNITSTMNNPTGSAGDGGVAVPINTTVDFDGTQSGKYLVMTGVLGQTDDYFKVKSLSATAGSGGQTPEPGTLALLALGLFGVVAMKRRPALA